jgi:DNA polymerase-3 subunit delta
MAASEVTYDSVLRDLRKKVYFPIYFLMGEEDFFIDKVSNFIIDNVLSETEKDFNMTVVYGSDIEDVASIVNLAKRYPMMAEHQVVVVKEAQNIKTLEALVPYLEKPQKSTLLVICYKHGVIDKRKKLASTIGKTGVLFESKKYRDYQLPAFIKSYLSDKNITIDPKASDMLSNHVGADLSRMSGELDKLIITLEQGRKVITPEDIEKNIGISKDYNNFELLNAVQEKNVLKANTIIKYFAENPKSNPIQVTTATLFNFFANLMLAYYSPDKSAQGLGNFLNIHNSWQVKNYQTAMRLYNAWKVMSIISDIRRADAMSKGVGNVSVNDGDILNELIFKILH